MQKNDTKDFKMSDIKDIVCFLESVVKIYDHCSVSESKCQLSNETIQIITDIADKDFKNTKEELAKVILEMSQVMTYKDFFLSSLKRENDIYKKGIEILKKETNEK